MDALIKPCVLAYNSFVSHALKMCERFFFFILYQSVACWLPSRPRMCRKMCAVRNECLVTNKIYVSCILITTMKLNKTIIFECIKLVVLF